MLDVCGFEPRAASWFRDCKNILRRSNRSGILPREWPPREDDALYLTIGPNQLQFPTTSSTQYPTTGTEDSTLLQTECPWLTFRYFECKIEWELCGIANLKHKSKRLRNDDDDERWISLLCTGLFFAGNKLIWLSNSRWFGARVAAAEDWRSVCDYCFFEFTTSWRYKFLTAFNLIAWWVLLYMLWQVMEIWNMVP